MFLFNKNSAAPHSRRTSIESLGGEDLAATLTSASTSTSEAFVSQSSDVSSSGDMPAPEEQQRRYLAKRSSVFKLRSRSNTTNSTASSFGSISSAMRKSDTSARLSQDLGNFPAQNPLDFLSAKRPLFARGKKGKRRSGAFSPNLLYEENEEHDDGSGRISVLRKGRRGTDPTDSSFRQLRHRISSPFDFQHLTHTDRDQFTASGQASESDLVAEFRAARASHASGSNPSGIRAGNLHFNNFSSESLAPTDSRSTSVLESMSPPLSPRQQPGSPLQGSTRQPMRTVRSVESFSQPGIPPRNHRHTKSATPVEDLPERSINKRKLERNVRSNRNSGIWDHFSPVASPPAETNKLPTIVDEPDYFSHAVTTPDDSAIHSLSPAYTPDLEDVAEEPERFASPRPAPSPPIRSPRSPRSPFYEALPSRRNQRNPISRTNSRASSYTLDKSANQRTSTTRPLSQMSDTLGGPTIGRRNSMRRPPAARRESESNTWRGMDDSWEDDIDYIYENSMEADCEFDWEQASEGAEEMEDGERTPEQQDHQKPSPAMPQHVQTTSVLSGDENTYHPGYYRGAFRPSLLVPSTSSVPELESRSAVSASTVDTGANTPSDIFSTLVHRQPLYAEAEGFILTPSLLVPQEYKENSREEMYNEILTDYEGSDRHFPIIDASQSVISSTRSSHIRSSKRSSYDSSLMSSGVASGSWGSPVRRSASSSGSLPELVHSRRSRRDFNTVVEQLSEQVATFTTSCDQDTPQDEDDDVTPPGRLSQPRTFFSADDEGSDAGNNQSAIESEVRESLELARQGSTRSSQASSHGHKHTSSDGAAKLLASAMPSAPRLQPAPRSRGPAANSSKSVRGTAQPYLSLFPTPPKHSPITTPISPMPSNNI